MSFVVKIEYLAHDEHVLGRFKSLSLAQDFVNLWFQGQITTWILQNTTLIDQYPQDYAFYKEYYKTIHCQWVNQQQTSEFLIIAESI